MTKPGKKMTVSTGVAVTSLLAVVRGLILVGDGGSIGLLDKKAESIARLRDLISFCMAKGPEVKNLNTKAKAINVGINKDEHNVSLNVTEVGLGVLDTV